MRRGPSLCPIGLPGECELRCGDLAWRDFLSERSDFRPVPCDPSDATTVLFSSGTCGAPKAIPWDQTTPIKAAVDAHLHHDIHPGDVLCWPTNMGWMMGPWLVYAGCVDEQGYHGPVRRRAPTTRKFGKFVQDAKVTMLGLVPSLVSAWREAAALPGRARLVGHPRVQFHRRSAPTQATCCF